LSATCLTLPRDGLLKIDHRVKNALATVNAVVSHTVQGRSWLGDFAAELEGRIRSIATAHELLSSHRWLGIPLRELVRRELTPYSTSNNTQIDGPEVLLEPQAGQAMAMVFHELAINAAKYGALSVPSGQVSVSWSHRQNRRTQGWLCIHWEERGGPNVVQQMQSGYGTSVIREMIPYSLYGTVDLVHAPDGVRCNMGIPERWLIGGDKPAIIQSADATPPFSFEFDRQPLRPAEG
jgi:two-component sensor histidine kinase